MPQPKGYRPPAAGIGKKPGTKNKITRDIKEMIVGALAAEGGQVYLQEQARKNPSAFMALVGKVLPLQITGTGPGEAIVIQWAKQGLQTDDDR